MRKVTNRKNKLSSCPARGKWVDTFIKLHGQKQSIANTPTQNIQNRVASFEDMLNLTKFSPFQKAVVPGKKNSRSAFDYTKQPQLAASVSANNFLKTAACTHQNSLHKNKEEQIQYYYPTDITTKIIQTSCNDSNEFSQQAEMKKLTKMIEGLAKYDQTVKQREIAQKSKIQQIQNARILREQQECQRFVQFEQDVFRESKKKGKIQNKFYPKTAQNNRKHIRNSQKQFAQNKSIFPFPTSMAKTQKQWHQLKQIEIKMQDKRVFLPLNAYSINNCFNSLKNTIKSLQNNAKKQFGMKFKKNYKRSSDFQLQIKELHQRNKFIENNFATRTPENFNFNPNSKTFSSNFNQCRASLDEFNIPQGDSKIDDNSIPKFLLRSNKSSKILQNFNGKRAMSSNVFRRQYVKML